MPVMNGYDTCKKINQMIENGQIYPLEVVAVTADVTQLNIEWCKKAGFRKTLSKPVSNSKLKTVPT